MRRIAGTCRVAAAAALLSVPPTAVLPAQAANPEGFHVQFGTRVQSASASGGGDSGRLVGESRSGAVIVAGFAAGMRSDTGGIPPKPMLAAFSRGGRLLWQQVYDRTGWEIVALNARHSTPRIVLWNRAPYDHDIRRGLPGGAPDNGRIELWSVDGDGELDRLLLGVDHDMHQKSVHASDEAFTLWMTSRYLPSLDAGFQDYVNVRSYDWSGEPIGDFTEFQIPSSPIVEVDANGGLYSRTDDAGDSSRELLVYVDREGRTVASAAVPDCGGCRFLDARRAGTQWEVLAAGDETPGRWQGLRLLEFDPAQGTVRIVHEYGELDGARVVFNELSDGGLLLTGRDRLAPLVAKLSQDRQLRWVRRFESGMHYTALARGMELADGKIAVTGITAPWGMLDSESDGDAILLVSDADGEYLERFGRCVVADGSLASALYTLAHRYGATVDLYQLGGLVGGDRRAYSGRLPRKVSPPEYCEDTAEIRLLGFLDALLDRPATDRTPTLPDVPYLWLAPWPANLMDGRAFRYGPSRTESRMVPEMAIDVGHGKEVADEVAENVVPYLTEITATHRWLEEESGFFFVNGDADAFNRYPFGPPRGHPLPPARIADIGRVLETSFDALADSEKRVLRRYAGWFTRVTIVDERGGIREDGRRRMYLPAAEAPRFWQWILDTTRPHEERIAAIEGELGDRLGITINGRPPVKPDEYRAFLERLLRELASVPDGDLALTMEFSTGPYGHLLMLGRGDTRFGTVAADISAENLALWIQRVPVPD